MRGILIPDFCWEELMRRRDLPENRRMLKDETVFLTIVKPSPNEMERAVDLIDFAYEYASLQLDMEHALRRRKTAIFPPSLSSSRGRKRRLKIQIYPPLGLWRYQDIWEH